MQFCQKHWDMLRAEVNAQGMGDWVVESGQTAAAQLANLLMRGEDTPTNYDPLMACHLMIMARSMEIAGMDVMYEDFGCPVCEFNSLRTPDGACGCTDPECDAKEPGSIPDFETWVTGPESAPVAAHDYMVERGWLTEGADA